MRAIQAHEEKQDVDQKHRPENGKYESRLLGKHGWPWSKTMDHQAS